MMRATRRTADFSGFAKRAKESKAVPTAPAAAASEGLRHLQVQLTKTDARRFRRAAEDRELSLQAALVEAVNRLLTEWGEAPVADPGTARS